MQINPQNNQSSERQAVNDFVAAMLARKDNPGAARRLAALADRPASAPTHPAQGARSVNSMQPSQGQAVAEAPDLLERIMMDNYVWENVILPERLREEAQGFAGLAEWNRNQRRVWDEVAGRDAAVMDFLLRGAQEGTPYGN